MDGGGRSSSIVPQRRTLQSCAKTQAFRSKCNGLISFGELAENGSTTDFLLNESEYPATTPFFIRSGVCFRVLIIEDFRVWVAPTTCARIVQLMHDSVIARLVRGTQFQRTAVFNVLRNLPYWRKARSRELGDQSPGSIKWQGRSSGGGE